MGYFDAILLGIIQGLTEFLPVSSSGHLALGQQLLGLKDVGIIFDLLLHGATLLSVLIYFHSKLFDLLRSLWQKDRTADRRLILLLFIGTLPIVIVGFTLKDPLEQVKNYPVVVSALLCLTGLILLVPGWVHRSKRAPTGDHTVRSAIIMGIGQAFAILPGISRSGSTIAAGMLARVDPSRAAEFSFLLAIPAICGAIVLKSKDIAEIPQENLGPYLAGMAAAFVTGLAAVYAVLAAIRKGKFQYFAYYCITAGLAAVIFFSLRG